MKGSTIFYSRDGNTKIIAEYIAEKWNTSLESLKELKPRRNFILSGYRAASKKRVLLTGDPWSEIKDKEFLFIGAPVWAGNGNPFLNSFLDKADLSGKKVYIFTLQADPQLKTGFQVLDFLSDRVRECGGEVISTKAFHGASPGKTAAKEFLLEQVKQWNIHF